MTDLAEAASPPAVPRRLPGRTRRRTDAPREYEKLNAERRRRIHPVLWPFFAPDQDQYCRWRVPLDCACIIELMTPGDQTLPSERQWRALDDGGAWIRLRSSNPRPSGLGGTWVQGRRYLTWGNGILWHGPTPAGTISRGLVRSPSPASPSCI